MWKGKNANAEERKGAMSQALVGVGLGEENREEREETDSTREREEGSDRGVEASGEGGGLRVHSAVILGVLCIPGSRPPGHLGASSGGGLPPQAGFREGREKWRLAFPQRGWGQRGPGHVRVWGHCSAGVSNPNCLGISVGFMVRDGG